MLAVAVVAAVVFDTLTSGDQGGDLVVDVSSEVEGLGPGRFRFDQPIEVSARPVLSGQPACVVAFDRMGQWFGPPQAMQLEEGRWVYAASASQLSNAHFGLVWVVVAAGLDSCETFASMQSASRGAERPVEALAMRLRQSGGVRYGVARIFVHDKLTQTR